MESLVIRHDLRKIWTAAVGLVLLAALEGAFLWLVHDLSNPVSAVLTLVLGILWAALLPLAAANVLAAVRLGGAIAGRFAVVALAAVLIAVTVGIGVNAGGGFYTSWHDLRASIRVSDNVGR